MKGKIITGELHRKEVLACGDHQEIRVESLLVIPVTHIPILYPLISSTDTNTDLKSEWVWVKVGCLHETQVNWFFGGAGGKNWT